MPALNKKRKQTKDCAFAPLFKNTVWYIVSAVSKMSKWMIPSFCPFHLTLRYPSSIQHQFSSCLGHAKSKGSRGSLIRVLKTSVCPPEIRENIVRPRHWKIKSTLNSFPTEFLGSERESMAIVRVKMILLFYLPRIKHLNFAGEISIILPWRYDKWVNIIFLLEFRSALSDSYLKIQFPPLFTPSTSPKAAITNTFALPVPFVSHPEMEEPWLNSVSVSYPARKAKE